MDKSLALFFYDDYLLAAVKPFNDKFIQLTLSSENEFPFYFFVDNISNKIDFSLNYKVDFYDQKPNYIGNFYELITDSTQTYNWYQYKSEYITLAGEIIKALKESYYQVLSKIDAGAVTNRTQPIEASYIFSENISEAAQEKLIAYFQSEGIVLKTRMQFDVAIVKDFIKKQRITVNNKRFAIVEATGKHLNMSIVDVNGSQVERKFFKQFEDFGTDPRIQVIAKKIVDDVNRQEGLLKDDADIKKEYLRHQLKARKIVEALKNFSKPYLRLETTYAVDPNRKIVINLAIEEIDRLSYLHARQFSGFFTDYFLNKAKVKTLDLEKIILIGSTLNNDMIKAEFARFGESRLVPYSNSDFSFVLESVFSGNDTQMQTDNNATMFLELEPANNAGINQKVYRKTDSITVGQLQPGQQVKLNNFDPAPGKGAATQEFEYIGAQNFRVISSTRSLMPNDIVTAITKVWTAAIQIDLEVNRGGKSLGVFRTRPVVTIEITG